MIDMHPIPPCVNIPRETWATLSANMRDEIVRAWQELSAGIAIAKDKRCGRPKSHRQHPHQAVSFYALHLLDMAIWRFPTNAVKIAEAEALRAKLAPDVERMAQNDSLQEYHELAERSGTTLAEALGKYVAAEQRLRADPVNEMARIMRSVGIDPEAWARSQLAQDDDSIPDEAA